MRTYEIEFVDKTGKSGHIYVDSSNDFTDGHPLNVPMLADLVDAFVTPQIREKLCIEGKTLYKVKLYAYPNRIGGVLAETDKVTITH